MTTAPPTDETTPASDYDSPWKEALERFFPEFLALLFPAIHAEIDWSKGVQFLDKEFNQRGQVRFIFRATRASNQRGQARIIF